jgi:hypothetical protein
MGNLNVDANAASGTTKSGITKPALVYVASLICVAPAVALVVLLALDPSPLSWAFDRGAIHTLVFGGGLVFAFGLAWAGTLLFFLRKASIWVLVACIPWPFIRAALGPSTMFAATGFAIGISAILAYCFYLKRRGLLR